MLLGARRRLLRRLVALDVAGHVRRRPEEQSDVDEQAECILLLRVERPRDRPGSPELAISSSRRRTEDLIEVVAEQVGPEPLVDAGYVMATGRCRAGEVGRRSAWLDRHGPPGGRLQSDQRRPRLHLRIHLGIDRPDHAIVRCDDGGFHLHAFHDGERITGSDDVARGDGHGDEERRGRAADLPAVVAGDDVRDAVDLDEQPGTPARGDDLVPPAVTGDRALESAEPLDTDLDQGGPGRAAVR